MEWSGSDKKHNKIQAVLQYLFIFRHTDFRFFTQYLYDII